MADVEESVQLPKNLRKIKLKKHEKELLESGELKEVTWKNARARHLSADSTEPPPKRVCVYRHMGDEEFEFLLTNGILPGADDIDWLVYQTIVEGKGGRDYCEKYFSGSKKSTPTKTTIVEFICKEKFVHELFEMQSKVEDGCLSHGLGPKAGHEKAPTLPSFNKRIKNGKITWRIVRVKRPDKSKLKTGRT